MTFVVAAAVGVVIERVGSTRARLGPSTIEYTPSNQVRWHRWHRRRLVARVVFVSRKVLRRCIRQYPCCSPCCYRHDCFASGKMCTFVSRPNTESRRHNIENSVAATPVDTIVRVARNPIDQTQAFPHRRMVMDCESLGWEGPWESKHTPEPHPRLVAKHHDPWEPHTSWIVACVVRRFRRPIPRTWSPEPVVP